MWYVAFVVFEALEKFLLLKNICLWSCLWW
ncbi:unnamed protein product [Acanthoscelides obtectus]|uniref:Uncharacterized protein n=1 Tax=Acanthoscelides obtectus TaxID=200917 RepID=A0A9P0KGT4_ACAOB|nr:unnamed protein product [Acanthoscelides obtectus]CAK1638624.1 hypothetical protein AOBTE_LOCUS10708 [Acanthoscelides obtectus]